VLWQPLPIEIDDDVTVSCIDRRNLLQLVAHELQHESRVRKRVVKSMGKRL
jgi:hypothetical protein